MSNAIIARLFYLSCELRPSLPDASLMGLLKAWGSVIKAASEHGLGGAAQALNGVSFDQLSTLYEAGIENGLGPDLSEFRSMLAGLIHTKLCESDSHSSLDKIKLGGKLDRWLNGSEGHVNDAALDWDAEVATPPFTKTGWFPFDKIHGNLGAAQEVSTVLSKPGVGKTTAAVALAVNWRRNDIGPVTMIQSEIAPAPLLMKVRGMTGKGLFRKGVDELIFGHSATAQALENLIENGDANRLVLFDSVTGYCGQGDTPASRERFANLYMALAQVKNYNRMVIAFTHVKRGTTDLVDIEAAAGSSAIERFSGSLVYLSTDGSAGPTGIVDIKVQALKNRYGELVRPFKFGFNYVTGEATPSFDDCDDEGELI